MAKQQHVRLKREIRFAPDGPELPSSAANTYAANPPWAGVGPVLCLAAIVESPIDLSTGMMVNIKDVDRILRKTAFEVFTHAPGANKSTGIGNLLLDCYRQCAQAFSPRTLLSLQLSPSPWARFEIHQKEIPMVRMSLRFEFAAAHRLHCENLDQSRNLELFGKCNSPNAHGHNYELEVVLAGKPDPSTGLVLPIGEFQQIINTHVIREFDHKHLNLDCPEFANLNPTVENIAQVIFDKLHKAFHAPAELKGVRVWETPKTCCEVLVE